MKNAPKSLAFATFLVSLALAGCSKKESHVFSSLKDPATAAQLKQFVAEKKSQAYAATGQSTPEFDEFFAAAEKGDWLTVSNHLGRLLNGTGGERLSGPRSAALREVWGALEAFGAGDEKYSTLFGNDIINSIPPGSIYFGGTDPGRFVVTAMQKSQVNGDPFFTLTQNAMADPTYLDYLRSMYDGKVYTPTGEDSQRCFQEYMADAEQRQQKNQLRPGEILRRDANGHAQASGQVAVMAVNGLLCKVVFDKNPDREFYVEESFPLDWMFPYLEPHGLIMKIDREPLAQLPEDVVQRDHDYWQKLVSGMIGDWLTDDTAVQTVTEFAEKVYWRKDLKGFTGDPRFVQDSYAPKMFSKLRSSIGGIYSWRLGSPPSGGTTPAQYIATGEADRARMIKEADFAFKEAFAICPTSPEAVYQYVQFLVNQRRVSDALLIAQTASRLDPANGQLTYLIGNLKQMH